MSLRSFEESRRAIAPRRISSSVSDKAAYNFRYLARGESIAEQNHLLKSRSLAGSPVFTEKWESYLPANISLSDNTTTSVDNNTDTPLHPVAKRILDWVDNLPLNSNVTDSAVVLYGASTSGESTVPSAAEESDSEEEDYQEEEEVQEQAIPIQPIMENIVAGYARNPINTPSLRRYAFPGAVYSANMITRNINIPYFTIQQGDTLTSRGFVLSMYARGRCRMEGWPTSTGPKIVAALESVAPNLPDACFANTEMSRYYFVMSTLCYLLRSRPSSTYHRCEAWPECRAPEGYQNRDTINNILMRFTHDNIAALEQNMIAASRQILGLGEGEQAITPNNITAHMAIACAFFLSSLHEFPTATAAALSTELYTLAYISIAKQGNITDAKLNSICNAVSAEVGRDINLTQEDVVDFSNSFKPYVTAENAGPICRGLQGDMQGFSLRLTITMQQAVRSGMTAYWAIYEAINGYRSFNWLEAVRLIPEDFTKYMAAVNLVRGNQYYGFNSDLQLAKHTNYLSLCWLACQVLIKADPPQYAALKRYRGMPTHPRKETALQALLDAFEPDNILQGEATAQATLTQIQNALGGLAME